MIMLRSRSPVRSVVLSLFAVALAIYAMFGGAQTANAGSIILWSATGASGSWNLVNSAPDGGAGTPNQAALSLLVSPVVANGVTINSLTLSSAQIPGAAFTTTSTVSISGSGTVYLAFGVTGFTAPAGNVTYMTQVSSLLNPSPSTGTIDAHNASWVTQNGLLPAAGAAEVNSAWQTGANLGGVPTPSSGVVFGSPAITNLLGLGTPYTITSELVIVSTGSGGTVGTSTTITPAPEPATMTLLGIGLVGMAGYGWRKRRQVSTVA